ncbi:hypothetical protein [Emticicia sp. C21]|uniref:hypothetical protein n=1 Tax=Emticicia sp. C21 TaxID=2302915 RepID=UPI000E34C9CA|nr:hypothetical protein [Emticicia sp. C21]RFS16739.1 hypothetical protein D0T08_08640 [Emticicia sp. C21]
MKNIYSTLFLLFTLITGAFAQSTTITAGQTANVQLPVLKNEDITAIQSPKAGMMVFDQTFSVVRVYNGSTWTCIGCSEQVYSSVQLASVESFTLGNTKVGTNTVYTANGLGTFKISDNGIGNVKPVLSNGNGNAQPNGFLMDNQDVIVFESTLPWQLQILPQFDLLNIINKCQWVNPYTYTQPVDVITSADSVNLIYTVREAGSFERRESNIFGMKAYRFRNKVFTEKYAPFKSFFDKLITANTSVDLYAAMNVSPQAYNIISTSPWFAVNDGILTFPRSATKPQSNYGLIYFIAKSNNLPSFRMRIFTHRPSRTSIDQYFDANGNIRNRSSYLENYYYNTMNTDMPAALNFSTTSPKLRLAGDPPSKKEVPPPTAGTEDL